MREDLLGALAVEAAGRLVGEDERRVVGERPGDGDALALTARELLGALVEVAGEAEALEQFLGTGAHRPARQAAEPAHRDLDVVADGELGQQEVELEDEADRGEPQLRPLPLV